MKAATPAPAIAPKAAEEKIAGTAWSIWENNAIRPAAARQRATRIALSPHVRMAITILLWEKNVMTAT